MVNFFQTLARSLSTKENGCGSVQLDAVDAMDGVGEGPLAGLDAGRFGDLPLSVLFGLRVSDNEALLT